MSGITEQSVKSARRHLALATISFTLCFAAWGLISAFAPRFRTLFALSAMQTALLVAVPVLLGSLARIPMGMLTDRFGGRLVFSSLMLAAAIPAFLVPFAASYRQLLGIGFLLGLAGSSFSVGVGYVSRFYNNNTPILTFTPIQGDVIGGKFHGHGPGRPGRRGKHTLRLQQENRRTQRRLVLCHEEFRQGRL